MIRKPSAQSGRGLACAALALAAFGFGSVPAAAQDAAPISIVINQSPWFDAGKRYVDVALPLPLRQTFTYRLPEDMTAAPGCRVRVPFGRGAETGVVLAALDEASLDPALRQSPGRLKEVAALLDPEPWLDDSLLALARWMADYYGASLGETLRAMIPVKAMKRPRATESPPPPEPDRPPRLSAAQRRALAAVEAAREQGRFTVFLLDGVTGSGKTEVYLRAIESTLARDQQAILLVPEISLTPQMARRFRARLGDRVGIFHSGLSAGERYQVWQRIRRGELQVVLGPRSAIFAPFPRLGLVVLDEEHDSSYKQSEKPRYHARSVALMRARALGAMVILGSATPSLESLHQARRGRYELLSLPERVGGGSRPRLEIVEMGTEGESQLSAPLIEALEVCITQGNKAIFLLNRRGHSRLRLCRDCGEVAACPRCDISLTYHASGPGRSERLLCHYCAHERRPERECSACGGGRWTLLGTGTQRLELEIGLLFPQLPVLRMDMDSTRRRGAHQQILEAFAAPGPALLLGTQMIAKGHHFPDVTLVGVISADTGLFFPDFRAVERSWQLLEQVAGRAGRGLTAGRVLVQTHNPEHPVLRHLAQGALETLVEDELKERRSLGYPPWRRLTSLVVSAPEEDLAARAAGRLMERFRLQWPESKLALLGPVQAWLPRLKGRYRQQILVKGSLDPRQKAWFPAAFAEIAKAMRRSGALGLEMDVDPESIL